MHARQHIAEFEISAFESLGNTVRRQAGQIDKDLSWCPISETLARPIVQERGGLCNLGLGYVLKRFPLWVKLSQKSITILVGPALLRMTGIRKVHEAAKLFLNELVVSKLTPVIASDCFNRQSFQRQGNDVSHRMRV